MKEIIGEEDVRVLIRDMVTSFCKNRGNGIESKAKEYVEERYGFYLKGKGLDEKVQQVLNRIQIANKIAEFADKIADHIIDDLNAALVEP